MIEIKRLLAALLVAFLLSVPLLWAADWQVVWKDDMQELRVDRNSVQVNGSEVEYWYSDQVDAIVDIMEQHYHAFSDCTNHRIRLLEVYDPVSGQTKPVQNQGWRKLPYDSHDAVTVIHYGVCSDYTT